MISDRLRGGLGLAVAGVVALSFGLLAASAGAVMTASHGTGVAGDITPPETTLGKHPKKKTESPTAKFAFSADDASASFQCAIDKQAFKACASPAKFKHLKPGKHKFQLVATDLAGNVSAPTVFRWKVRAG